MKPKISFHALDTEYFTYTILLNFRAFKFKHVHISKQRSWSGGALASKYTDWNLGRAKTSSFPVQGLSQGTKVFTSDNHNPGARVLALRRASGVQLGVETVRERVDQPGCTVRQLRVFAAANGPDVRPRHLQFSFSAAT